MSCDDKPTNAEMNLWATTIGSSLSQSAEITTLLVTGHSSACPVGRAALRAGIMNATVEMISSWAVSIPEERRKQFLDESFDAIRSDTMGAIDDHLTRLRGMN